MRCAVPPYMLSLNELHRPQNKTRRRRTRRSNPRQSACSVYRRGDQIEWLRESDSAAANTALARERRGKLPPEICAFAGREIIKEVANPNTQLISLAIFTYHLSSCYSSS